MKAFIFLSSFFLSQLAAASDSSLRLYNFDDYNSLQAEILNTGPSGGFSAYNLISYKDLEIGQLSPTDSALGFRKASNAWYLFPDCRLENESSNIFLPSSPAALETSMISLHTYDPNHPQKTHLWGAPALKLPPNAKTVALTVAQFRIYQITGGNGLDGPIYSPIETYGTPMIFALDADFNVLDSTSNIPRATLSHKFPTCDPSIPYDPLSDYNYRLYVNDFSNAAQITLNAPEGKTITYVIFTPYNPWNAYRPEPYQHIVQQILVDNVSVVTRASSARSCYVEDKDRNVPFYSQVDPNWANDPFGLTEFSSTPGDMRKYGCSITNAAMIFKSYGIHRTPYGSPASIIGTAGYIPHAGLLREELTPKTLNYAMANYTSPVLSSDLASIALNKKNDPVWAGVVEVARAGYKAQCGLSEYACNPASAKNVVSVKTPAAKFGTVEQKYVEDQICAGNPIMLKFSKASGLGQHFMLATGFKYENGNVVWRLNNPGVLELKGKGVFYTDDLKTQYPSILGYVPFVPAADPSMMILTAPTSVDFVLTDTLGRKTGYDPVQNMEYNEIPGASYFVQSVSTPNEEGFADETLVTERYFMSTEEVASGNYQIQVFGNRSGNYELEYRGYDVNGFTNASQVISGSVNAGQSQVVQVDHSDESRPEINALLDVDSLTLSRKHKKWKSVFKWLKGKRSEMDTDISLKGRLDVPGGKVILSDGFLFEIGGLNGFKISFPAWKFEKIVKKKEEIYIYDQKDIKIVISSKGEVELRIRRADLSGISAQDLETIMIKIDSNVGMDRVEISSRGEMCHSIRSKRNWTEKYHKIFGYKGHRR